MGTLIWRKISERSTHSKPTQPGSTHSIFGQLILI